MLYFQFQVVVFEPAIWLFLTIVTVFCHGDSLQKWRGKAEKTRRKPFTAWGFHHFFISIPLGRLALVVIWVLAATIPQFEGAPLCLAE